MPSPSKSYFARTGAVTEKFASETSKKTFPTASILTRACEVTPIGIVTSAEPSFGVLAKSTVGKVWPPSVESEILTFATLTGAAVVLATFQVTVWTEPPATWIEVFGDVTLNGPEEFVTVMTESVY